MPSLNIPSVDQVERIAALADPALRNLQITQCYHELSAALAARTGRSANWCTFATWASKQAGQSIRKEDLRRTLELAIEDLLYPQRGGDEFARELQAVGAAAEAEELRVAAGQAVDFRPAVERASDAVGRGNKKVFEEIGREFARFEAGFLQDLQPDEQKLSRFCESLRPGEPPDGQRYLRQAFRRYYRAFFTADPKTQAELLLCANIEIGFHEQTRLQPEITEALDSAFLRGTQFVHSILAASSPFYGLFSTALWWGRRWLGRPTATDRAIQALLRLLQERMRRAITEVMMTIRFPPEQVVRLGEDLRAAFPESLRRIDNPDLRLLLARFDPAPDSTSGSGAADWAELPDRLHFIVDLFRCFQETPALFDPPFTPEQVAALEAGKMPHGRL
jgi:hypothetical protein